MISYSESTPSLRALADIPKCSEIFISYIDVSNETTIRQRELRDRYFFTCPCAECAAQTTLGRPDIPLNLPESLSAKDFRELVERGREKLSRANAARRTESKPDPSFYREGLALFSPLKSFFAIHRQPYALLRSELAATLVEAREFVEAFRQKLVQHFSIDPVHYPQSFHPVRVVHTWILLRLAVNMKGQVYSALIKRDTGVDVVTGGAGLEKLKRLEVDWDMIVFGICQEVNDNVGRSHGVESVFARKVRRVLNTMGMNDMGGVPGYEGKDWKKLEKWAAEVE